MRWQRELIGGIIALSVAVVGGVIVYYLTIGPAKKSEELTYQVAPLVSFSGDDNTVSIGSVRFTNSGGTAATEVVATITATGAKIIDVQAARASGPNPTSIVAKDQRSAVISVRKLLPGDSIQATYLLDQRGQTTLDLRSDATIGKSDDSGEVSNDKKDKRTPALAALGAITVAIAVMLFQLRRITKRPARDESLNNNAFVLLHTGHAGDAAEMLARAVHEGKDGSFAMANLAGALAVTGQLSDAKKYLAASRFLAETNHQQAIVDLNAALLAHALEDREGTVTAMQGAFSKSKDVRAYAAHSSLIQGLVAYDSRIKALVTNQSEARREEGS